MKRPGLTRNAERLIFEHFLDRIDIDLVLGRSIALIAAGREEFLHQKYLRISEVRVQICRQIGPAECNDVALAVDRG